MIIRPFESFAKDLFGVFRMSEIVSAVDEFGGTFALLREEAWRAVSEEERAAYRELARRLSS